MMQFTDCTSINNPSQCSFCHGSVRLYWREVDVWKCSSCGLLLRHPLPSEKDLAKLYQKSWSDPHEYTSETGGKDLDLARSYAKKLASSVGFKDFRGLRILDFGAGRGAMLTALEELGADVYAVEPFGYQFLESRGFITFRTLNEIPKGVVFDGIIAIDVVEHLYAPWNELRRFSEILKDSGWVYIATPNACGLNAKIFRSGWQEVLKPGHLLFFTPRSLQAVLTHCGMMRSRRLRWFIKYNNNPVYALLHYFLQSLYLGGEINYLAWKS